MDYLEPKQLPLPRAPECPACLDTAIVRVDGSARVLTGQWSTMAELLAEFKPCPLCAAGEKLAPVWVEWRAEWRKPPIEAVRGAVRGAA